MTLWTVHVQARALAINVQLDFIPNMLLDTEPMPALSVGDRLQLEFSDNNRAGGAVESVAASSAVIEVAGARWEIAPHGGAIPAAAGMRSMSWVVIAVV